MQIIDVAGGTGDIAFRLLEHATKLNRDTTAKVRVVDINEKMLKFGRRKVEKGDMQNWQGRIKFEQGNAETLEGIGNGSVDLYTIAFGIRNVTHIDRVLKSAYRVLKPGGVFACLVSDHQRMFTDAGILEAYESNFCLNLSSILVYTVTVDGTNCCRR
jgi:2-methoxy-6-polyprenyl-1,4-benzoquinol methylase